MKDLGEMEAYRLMAANREMTETEEAQESSFKAAFHSVMSIILCHGERGKSSL